MRNIRALLYLALLGCVPFVAGCGAGGNASVADTSRGTIEFSIKWPSDGASRSRIIPIASQSLSITLTNAGGQQVGTRLIPRPPAGTNTTSVRFDSLVPGVLNVSISAFPTANGTGTVQAIGAATIAIIGGSTVQINIDPLSTVDRLELTPNPIATIPGLNTQVQVSPLNSSGAIVLVSPTSIKFSSDAAAVATADAAGIVHAVALGTANIQVVDNESGKTASVPVKVVDPVVISPKTVTLTFDDQTQFTATVTGLSSPEVVWKVEEQSGGTISQNGNYTAPKIAGTYHITVTSSVDSTRFATAVVTVQKGSGTIIIQ